jgi:hypothetical protein
MGGGRRNPNVEVPEQFARSDRKNENAAMQPLIGNFAASYVCSGRAPKDSIFTDKD